MERIRILMTRMAKSPMLGEIVEEVMKSRVDMEVLAERAGRPELLRRVEALPVDAVILELCGHELPGVCEEVMSLLPHAVVVGVVDDGRRFMIGAPQLGVEELLDTIRAARGARRPTTI